MTDFVQRLAAIQTSVESVTTQLESLTGHYTNKWNDLKIYEVEELFDGVKDNVREYDDIIKQIEQLRRDMSND